MNLDPPATSVLSDRDLVLRFESLGDNCELGLVQRMVGVEPLGLFRFAGTPVRHLIRALKARFAGIADADAVRVQPQNDEYMIKLARYDFIYHAHVKIGEADPVLLQKQHTRTVGFLADKLVTDLIRAEKILVFRQNEELSANDLLDLRAALATYGPATLLWVQQARAEHPPGTVVVVDDTLIVGYVTRLACRDNAPDLDLRSWLGMLRAACAACPVWLSDAVKPISAKQGPRIDVYFGSDGNAGALTEYGWSAPETGFTWAVGDRSSLTIDNPGMADRYWLAMDVVPFVAPPILMTQTLGVLINGELVHTFDPLPRGEVGCAVPHHLLNGRDVIKIVLVHPNATSPRTAAGQDDDRRLAVSFYRLSLIGS